MNDVLRFKSSLAKASAAAMRRLARLATQGCPFERKPKESALPERHALLCFLRDTPALRCYPMHFSMPLFYASFGTLAGSFA